MARWYVLQGPHGTREEAEEAHAALNKNHTRLRVARLRDRTGPSVADLAAHAKALDKVVTELGYRMAQFEGHPAEGGAGIVERLAAVESALGEPVCVGCGGTVGQHHAPDGGGCSGWFPTVREHLARIETEHRAAVYRISDLERLPVAPPPATTEPTPEQMEAYLRRSAEWSDVTSRGVSGEQCWQFRDHVRRVWSAKVAFDDLCTIESRTPAEMRARILGASSGAAEDRLAKVAEPTDDDLLALFGRSEYASGDTRAARRALYNLGREHGRAEREVAPTSHVPDGETRDRPATPTEAEMAAELRAAGWYVLREAYPAWAERPERWTDATGKAAPALLRNAYAAMRAAKGAK